MPSTRTVIEAQIPGFEVGAYPLDPAQHDVGCHGADSMRPVGNALCSDIVAATVGSGNGAGIDIGRKKPVQTFGRGAVDADFHSTDNLPLADTVVPAAAGRQNLVGIGYGWTSLESLQPNALVMAKV